jgi:UPF0176 protein
MSYTVAALYQFTRFDDPAALIPPLELLCTREGVKGTLLLAEEGINGTIAGPEAGIAAVVAEIRALPGCGGIAVKYSQAEEMPFLRLKLRRKREIVTMGQPGVDPLAAVGAYVEPQHWNALISDPDVVVVDTRNDYEVALGSFRGAVDPKTESFREFPGWWEAEADAFAGKTVAMFCTGGIRCEKATNYLLSKGVRDVRHLKGGILRYLEEVPEEESLWDGACFVFDGRVSVTHGLEEGEHVLCHACRRPLDPQDLERPEYERGVSCHRCLEERSEADRARYRERQKQIDLGRARGTPHLG